jgi:hypothetical protein
MICALTSPNGRVFRANVTTGCIAQDDLSRCRGDGLSRARSGQPSERHGGQVDITHRELRNGAHQEGKVERAAQKGIAETDCDIHGEIEIDLRIGFGEA